jgi:hypothetical protein
MLKPCEFDIFVNGARHFCFSYFNAQNVLISIEMRKFISLLFLMKFKLQNYNFSYRYLIQSIFVDFYW